MTPLIHPTAVIDSEAVLADDVRIGAFTVVGEGVRIGSGTVIGSHCVIEGPTTIGADNEVSQFCSLGAPPQHKAHKGEPTRLEIGDRNVIREYVSMHRGTMIDQGLTHVGSDNMIMAYCHVAHDCVLGDQITMANGASLAGHAHIGNYCILGGFALVYQFCRVGAYCFLGFGSGIAHDVPPFLMVSGYPAKPHGINSEGMRRRGISEEDIRAVRQAYKVLYRRGLRLVEACEQLDDLASGSASVRDFLDFVQAESKRGLLR